MSFLNPDEPVFGVTINGESRAYPHRIMGWHELANDRLGGELITFVFLTLCNLVVVYDSELYGGAVEFGTSGFLFQNNKLM